MLLFVVSVEMRRLVPSTVWNRLADARKCLFFLSVFWFSRIQPIISNLLFFLAELSTTLACRFAHAPRAALFAGG